jgi:hypothetical protein
MDGMLLNQLMTTMLLKQLIITMHNAVETA